MNKQALTEARKCECVSKHPDERENHRFLKTACHGSGQVWDEEIVRACLQAAINAATDGQPDWLKGTMLEESTLRALHLAIPAVLAVLAEAQPLPPAGEP